MKRAQISVDTFILLAALAFAALIIFAIVYPVVKEVIETEGEKGTCEWSLVMHSIAKLGDWSLIPAECRANRIEIDLKYLERYHKEAKKRMEIYAKDQTKYAEIYKIFKDPKDPNMLNEWALNKIVATEMKNCWDQVLKGQLPLFDQWWKLYSWGPHREPTDGEVAFETWFNVLKMHQPPVNCIVCSRIKFSDDVRKKFGSKNTIDSLDVWMRNNYPKIGGKSYYESLTEGRSALHGQRIEKYDLNTPLAVLYEKIHIKQGFFKLSGDVLKLFGLEGTKSNEINWLKIVPYTQKEIIGIRKEGGESCTFILD
jgi:hypothetical protein